MLVTIVAVANADNTGLDLDRVEKVEDLHDDIARPMLDLGTARQPSDEELAAYHKAKDSGRRGKTPAGKVQPGEDRSNAGQDDDGPPEPASVTTDLRPATQPAETPAP